MGQIYQLNHQLDRAESAYRQAGETKDADSTPWLLLGRLLSRDPARVSDAESALQRAVAIDRDSRYCGPLKELAELKVHYGDDAGAIKLLDDAINRNSDCYCSLVLRGEIAVRNNDLDNARQFFERAIHIGLEPVLALTALARISESKVAEELIGQAVESDPMHPHALLARGRILTRDINDRIDDVMEALARDPDLAEAMLELAILQAKQGNREAALECLADALNVIPSRMEIIPGFVDTALELARAGYLDEVATILEGKEGRSVEPLCVALKLYRGEQPIVAKEILDVANDILSKMNSKLKS